VSGSKIETRSKLLIAALGLLVVAGCVPVGYYDQGPYGYGGSTGVVVDYNTYRGGPYYGRPAYHGRPAYYSDRHWDRGHPYWR
jgi:hypothetical protein